MTRVRSTVVAVLVALGATVLVAAPATAAQVTLSGVISDANGPVTPATVRVSDDVAGTSFETAVNPDGSYAISVPATGKASLAILVDRAYPAQLLVVTDPFDLSASRVENVPVPLVGFLRVHVLLGDNGPGLPNAAVAALRSVSVDRTSGGIQVFTGFNETDCQTDGSGICDVPVLAPGTVQNLTVTPAGGYPTTFPGVATPGALTTTTVAVPASQSISGVLTTADGSALAGTSVTVSRTDGSAPATTTTAADGSYALTYPPVRVQLTIRGTIPASGAPYLIQTGPVDLDRPRTISLALPAVVPLHLAILDGGSRPVAGARVAMSPYGSRLSGTTPDAIGYTAALFPADGPAASCASSDAAGSCVFPVFASGTTGGFTVDTAFTSDYFPGITVPLGSGTDTTLRLTHYASVASAGDTSGPIVLTTLGSGRVTALDASQASLPPEFESLFGRIDYRIKVDPGSVTPIALHLPGGAAPDALLRVGADGRLTDITADSVLSPGQIVLNLADGGPGDADGIANGYVAGNVVPIVRGPFVVSTDSLRAAAQGKPYSVQLSQSGAFGATQWDLAGGALPPGLTLGPDGVISGTPTRLGSYGITVRVRDSVGASATRSLGLTVSTIAVVTTSVPDGYQGGAYSVPLKYAGGSVVSWHLGSGSLPPGLTLSSSGTLSGRPTKPGRYPFGVLASSGSTTSPLQELVLVVHPMEIATASLPDAAIAAPYSAKLTTRGGAGTLTWSIVGGSLPTGVVLSSSGSVSGRPSTVGTWAVTVRVVDTSTPVRQVSERSLSLTVRPMTITTASLPSVPVAQAYPSTTLKVLGGAATYTWSVVGGALPTGLRLSGAGTITGTPTQVGPSSFTVQVRDAVGRTAVRQFTVVITPMQVLTASLPTGRAGTYFASTLKAAGGKPTLVWSIADGTLPPGIGLSSAGQLSGTPSRAGSWNFTVRVVDASTPKNQATRALTLTVG